jgi:hypothetical protein
MIAAPEMQTPGCNLASAEENTENIASVPPADDSGNAAVNRITDRLERAGFVVHRLASEGWLVSRWGKSKHCPDPRTLAGFAHQVGVR